MAAVLTKTGLLSNLQTFANTVLGTFKGPPLTRLRVGLCVSGGPDSMALATLMASLTEKDLGFEIEPVGFIVDHNARPGSADEAQTVSEQLSKLSMPSYISRIQWGDVDPLRITNFESEARIRRYYELTLTAINLGIRHLFLGHHRDDQIETVLLRLVGSPSSSFLSLRGMEADGSIPASHSIYGARQEVPAVAMKTILQCGQSSARQAKTFKEADLKGNPRLTVNDRAGRIMGYRPHGIQIHRPLLNISKPELIATCKAHSVHYILDKTNDDPEFTARNAVRLLRTHRLPQALQADSILRLVEISQAHSLKLQSRVLEYLQKVPIIVLDLKSATAIIRLPGDFEHLASDDKLVAAGVFAHLCQLVMPISADKARSLEEEHRLDLFLSKIRSQFWRRNHKGNAPSFSCSKVQFEGIPPVPDRVGDSTFWRLSRQPMHQEKVPRTTFDPAKVSIKDHPQTRQRFYLSEWTLWDNRFWIQVSTTDKGIFDHLVVRPFERPDWEALSKQVGMAVVNSYRGIINNTAPGKIRYTLPVIEFRGSIIAFPTLTDEVLKTHGLMEWVKNKEFSAAPKIEWQVNYKVLPESVIKWASTVGKNMQLPSSRSTHMRASTDPPSPSSYHFQNQRLPSLSTHAASRAPSE